MAKNKPASSGKNKKGDKKNDTTKNDIEKDEKDLEQEEKDLEKDEKDLEQEEKDLEQEEKDEYENGEMLIEEDETIGYQSRIRLIQKEFNMSNEEVEEINEFIHAIPLDTGMEDVLEMLIKSENLNIRQKVAFSHAIGIFRTEDAMNSSKRIVTIKVPRFKN